MPSAVDTRTLKRKRKTVGEVPVKKARSESSDDASSDATDATVDILTLEKDILASKKNYNSISTLLNLAKPQDDDQGESMLATVALCRVFLRLLAAGALRRQRDMPDKDVVVTEWLRERLQAYHQLLLSMVAENDQVSAGLELSMRLLKAEGQTPSNEQDDYSFPITFLSEIIGTLCDPRTSKIARRAFVEDYVNVFDDVRIYTFMATSDMLKHAERGEHELDSASFDSVFDLLSAIDTPGDQNGADNEREYLIGRPKKKGNPVLSIAQHKKNAQEAWLALLRIGLDKTRRKRVLDILSHSIAPWFVKPELLMDFLLDSYNEGGATTLLALSGVYYLIQERNLDYPDFYRKLYSLLDADILHSKHRSRFFRLLETFLSSSHLPAALVASFIKRLARLSLNAPPAAIVTIVPYMYNLFKRHPTTTFMMHRVPRDASEDATEGINDPFLPEETDPMETHAIDSCLWEIVQLQSHYHPNVATIANIISEQFTKDFYNMEDFLDHSYSSLLEAEMVKPVRKAPVVEFHIPKKILSHHEDETEDSLLVKLWDFA